MSKRSLTLNDGSSNKFWEIELAGTSHTVRFGRVGTSGQSQTKEFDDDAEAKKSFDKLIAQKIKKGYADDPSGSGEPAKVAKTAVKPAADKKKASSKKTSKISTPAPVEAAAAEVDLRVTHELGLTDEEPFAASYIGRKPIASKPAGEADVPAQIERLSKLRTNSYGWDLKFETLKLSHPMPVEEAHFWFTAMTQSRRRLDDAAAVKRFAGKVADQGPFDGQVSTADAVKALNQVDRNIPDPTMLVMASLFNPVTLVDVILKVCRGSSKKQAHAASMETVSICAGFRRHVLPHISEADKSSIWAKIEQSIDPSFVPGDSYSSFQAEHYLAACLGMHEQSRTLLNHLPDNFYATAEEWCSHYQQPTSIVCGLGSAEEVEEQWRRLKIPIVMPDDAKVLIACTGVNALDLLADGIIKQSNKDPAAALMKVLAAVRAPEAAVPILRCRLESKAPAIARDWLDTHVGNAVTGLLAAAGGQGKFPDAVIDYLRGIKRAGHEAFIVKQLGQLKLQPEVVDKVTRDVIDHVEKVYQPLTPETTPRWLAEALQTDVPAKSKKLPTWAVASQVPPMLIQDNDAHDRRLSDEQIDQVMQTLAAIPVTQQHPLLSAIKQHADRASRDAFAWRMFELWKEDGSVATNKWAMGAIGHLGDDDCVLKLTPMVRTWPGESQHQRAVFGLECLRAVGSNTALMQLSGIAQKLKFKGLKTKAAAFVEDIAKERGMTRAELEDRVIPDCELDEKGQRSFSFGPRSFSFVLGGDLKPMVRDEAGKVHANMPKPGVKDDAEIAAASLAEWKLIKKQIKEVATLQAGRLEQSMVTGRRWNVEDFERLMVRHPLMTHLVQKLIWGEFDAKNKLIQWYRVTDERDYAGVDDDAVTLEVKHQIGLMHPLEMDEASRRQWGEVMSDYELIAPFPQLGRDVYKIETTQGGDKQLSGFEGLTLAAPTMVFTLEKLGWTRGEAMDAGCFDEHSKQFPSADITAVVHYDGVVGMGYIDPDETLKVDKIIFCHGMRAPSGYGWDNEKTCQLKDVSPIVISEVMADMQVLKAKAK